MNNTLKKYFPIIRTKDEIIQIINKNNILKEKFYNYPKHLQNELLNCCSGAKGLKILYDPFFKEIFNPEYNPSHLNDLLSEILGTKVKIKHVLPADSTRLGDETTLLIMDIVAELENGELINIEMQKIGYAFPGERCACYSSDLLLRQYKRIRDSISSNREFNYNHIKSVYTIVFFEKSPNIFKKFPNTYIHNFQQTSDTGLKLNLLQKYTFIPLDIYTNLSQNINTKLDAWLTFLSSDNPSDIIKIIEKYPEFKTLYDVIYGLCLNIEGVIDMFSPELYELDRGTVLYMVDEMQKEIDEKKLELAEMNNEIAEKDNEIAEKDNEIAEKDNEIAKKDNEIAEKDNEIAEKDNEIAEKDNEIAEKDNEIARLKKLLAQKNSN